MGNSKLRYASAAAGIREGIDLSNVLRNVKFRYSFQHDRKALKLRRSEAYSQDKSSRKWVQLDR
uniref:Uncharacterized protein n=1 Tax=Helianthus annuus TaxID=4232 RepID=A0A251RPC2_HELAN